MTGRVVPLRSAVLPGLRGTHALTHVIGQMDNLQLDAVMPRIGHRPLPSPCDLHRVARRPASARG
jgi:hypothetical protein